MLTWAVNNSLVLAGQAPPPQGCSAYLEADGPPRRSGPPTLGQDIVEPEPVAAARPEERRATSLLPIRAWTPTCLATPASALARGYSPRTIRCKERRWFPRWA